MESSSIGIREVSRTFSLACLFRAFFLQHVRLEACLFPYLRPLMLRLCRRHTLDLCELSTGLDQTTITGIYVHVCPQYAFMLQERILSEVHDNIQHSHAIFACTEPGETREGLAWSTFKAVIEPCSRNTRPSRKEVAR